MTKPKAKYLWLDLETDGLDASENRILEAAWIITSSSLNILGTGRSIVNWPRAAVMNSISDWCTKVHTDNGLLDKVTETGTGHRNYEVEQIILGDVEKFDWGCNRPILAGSSPHFDRTFIREWMPTLDNTLHYRHLDVSALKMAMDDVGRGYDFYSNGMHRAEPDVRDSLAHAIMIYQHCLR